MVTHVYTVIFDGKYDHWKRRGDSLVLSTIEGEISAKGRRGRRRYEWIDNIHKRVEK